MVAVLESAPSDEIVKELCVRWDILSSSSWPCVTSTINYGTCHCRPIVKYDDLERNEILFGIFCSSNQASEKEINRNRSGNYQQFTQTPPVVEMI